MPLKLVYAVVFNEVKCCLSVMNDLKTRGMQDVLIFCTDNLIGLNEAINACYPNADHQNWIIHQIRNSVKHVFYKDLNEVYSDLKSIYKAPNAEIGFQNLTEFEENGIRNIRIFQRVG